MNESDIEKHEECVDIHQTANLNNDVQISPENEMISVATSSIISLCSLWKTNPYALSRLSKYLTNMQSSIEADLVHYEKKQTKIIEYDTEYNLFLEVFLQQNKYYYLQYTGCFYEYSDGNYSIIKEDDVHYKLLTNINKNSILVQNKHKSKQLMIKKIKERCLFASVPNSSTNQNVVSFLHTIFSTEDISILFLTILGDTILKKPISHLYIVSVDIKPIIELIYSLAHLMCGNNNINSFVTKSHKSHSIDKYRTLGTVPSMMNVSILRSIVNNIGIDILCVATYFSNKYENSETFYLMEST